MRGFQCLLALSIGLGLAGCGSGGYWPGTTADVDRPSIVPEELKAQVRGQIADLPAKANASVTSTGDRLVVSAHILEAYPADDSSPVVKGNYWTHEMMKQVIEQRLAQICRRIFTNCKVPPNVIVCLKCCHGVRVTYVGAFNSMSDQPRVLYTAEISGARTTAVDWSKATDEEIVRTWTVTYNDIANLQFQSVP